MTLRHGREYRQIVVVEFWGLCRLRLPPPPPLLAVLSTKGVKSTLSFLLMRSSIVPPEDWQISFIWPTFFNQLINSWEDFSLKYFLQGKVGIVRASVQAAGHIAVNQISISFFSTPAKLACGSRPTRGKTSPSSPLPPSAPSS